nr:uncharacterized protein LOC109150699 isoform X4 [Ipomoea batatas]
MFHDVDRIKDLDWCGYLLRSLVTTHRGWAVNKTRKFTGPLLFLTLLYVDRVVVGARDVPRTIPTLNEWSAELIKAREAHEITTQGFGHGQLDAPLHTANIHARHTEPSVADPQVQADPLPEAHEITTQGFGHGQLGAPLHTANIHARHTEPSVADPQVQPDPLPEAHEITTQGFAHGQLGAPLHTANIHARHTEPSVADPQVQADPLPIQAQLNPPRGTPMGIVKDFETTTGELLSVVERVVAMVRQHPNQTHEDPNFARVAQATKLLLRLTEDQPKGVYDRVANDPQTSDPSTAQHDEAFWHDPDNIRALEEAEMAALRASAVPDIPTFSPGLTQDLPVHEHGGDITTDLDMPSFSLGFTQEQCVQGQGVNTTIDLNLVTPPP